eukprot:2033861-Rhodomonas_salina.1
MWYDGAVGKMGILHMGQPLPRSVRALKPDGVAQSCKDTKGFLLEFTRTTDFWPNSLSVALARKLDKVGYIELQSELHSSLLGWDIDLLTLSLVISVCLMNNFGPATSIGLVFLRSFIEASLTLQSLAAMK